MPLLSLKLSVSKIEQGKRADDVLLNRLKLDFSQIGAADKVSKTKIRRLFLSDVVTLDGRLLRNPGQILQSGSIVVALIDPEDFASEKDPGDTPITLDSDSIIFEDEWLIAINKPSGIPSEGTRVASRDNVLAALRRFLSVRDKLESPYVVPHHRLDRDTSGVLLFSKSPDANPGLHYMFEHHLAKKTYEALCLPALGANQQQEKAVGFSKDGQFRVENHLDRISPASKAARWGAVANGGLVAITDFTVLDRNSIMMRIQAKPLTGRTHQIRVHLAGLGFPILGDARYGGAANLLKNPQVRGRDAVFRVDRVMLHAQSLIFQHPILNTEVHVQAPPPKDFLSCLKAGRLPI